MISASISIGYFYNVLARRKLIFVAHNCNRVAKTLSYTPPSMSGDTHAVPVGRYTPLQYSLDSDCFFPAHAYSTSSDDCQSHGFIERLLKAVCVLYQLCVSLTYVD